MTWTVRNTGGSATDATWIDGLLLTQLGTTNVTGIGGFTSVAPLEGGRDITRSERVTVPTTLAGQYQLSLVTNAGLFPIYETSHTNDTLVSPSPLTVLPLPLPDLQVASIDQAPAAIASGGTVALSYTVVNQSDTEASGHWKDTVYLSYVNHLDSSAIPIGTLDNPEALVKGQSYSLATPDLAVPKRLGGNAYLIVATNSNAGINEADTTNDTFVKSIYITPEPPADLVASNVVAPDQAVGGSTFNVTYHVTNLGLKTTDKTTWTDTIWLTHDKTRPNPSKGDVLLATVVHTGALGDDPSVITLPTSYDNTVSVTLPKHISGQYFITAWSDTLDSVYKSTQSVNVNPDDPTQINNDNYKARPIAVLPTPPADLIVTSVSPQAAAVGGDDYKVVWTVKNQGAGATEAGTLFDQVYLSDTPNFVVPNTGKDIGNQWYLGPSSTTGPSIRATATPPPPPSNCRPTFRGAMSSWSPTPAISSTSRLTRGPYTNNDVGTATTQVTPLAPADLRVVSVVGSAPNFSGEQATATWTVQNFGATVWSQTQFWKDSLYLSRYPTFDVNTATKIGEYAHADTTPLKNGDSYTQSETFTLPQGIGGTAAAPQTYYLYVIADFDGNVSAHSRDNESARESFFRRGYEDGTNNQGAGTLPVIYREPNLKVVSFTPPVEPIESGSSITISWTVKNLGGRDTRTGNWTDAVFLSRDPSLDASDTELDAVIHSDILKSGDQYSVTRTIQLPDGLSGDYYLIVYTDSTAVGRLGKPGVGFDSNSYGEVAEFQDEGDNISANPIEIDARPAPNLQVQSVVASGPDAADPGHVLAGQNYTVTYTVLNAGPGDTPPLQGAWTDYVYLSRDTVLSDSDYFLGSHDHTGGLAANQSYTAALSFTADRSLSGPWYVIVKSDPPTSDSPYGKVYEAGLDDNTRASATPILIDVPPPADLIVPSVVAPTSAMTGDMVTVTWSVLNQGVNPAVGSWIDMLYLSTDNVWDIHDTSIASFVHTGPLAAGDGYTMSRLVQLPAAFPGSYRILVRTDVFDDVAETREDNNVGLSLQTLQIDAPQLTLGTARAVALDPNVDQLFKVVVPQGATLRVDVTAPDATASDVLYLKYNGLPSGTTYDAAYASTLQANQFAVIPSTTTGTYYVLVRGEANHSVAATVLAQLLPFEITDVMPDIGGDGRFVTTTISGAQFDPQAIVKLVRPGFAEYEPVSYTVDDKTRITAVFDLSNAPHGLYDLEVINPNGQIALAPYRYLIESAVAPDVSISLGGSRVVWAGQSAVYGFTITSLSNVDTPYVDFSYGIPTTPLNEGVPYLSLTTSLTGTPNVAGVNWSSVSPVASQNGNTLTTGYAIDLADSATASFNFEVKTYPNGLPPGAYGETPASRRSPGTFWRPRPR